MWLAACFLARYSGRMTLRRWHASLTLRLFAFALAYALAFAPALADAARGLTKAAHPAGMAMCLTSRMAPAGARRPSGLHDECCLGWLPPGITVHGRASRRNCAAVAILSIACH